MNSEKFIEEKKKSQQEENEREMEKYIEILDDSIQSSTLIKEEWEEYRNTPEIEGATKRSKLDEMLFN